MRKTYLFALIAILFYSSCGKDFQNNTPENFNYSINKSDLTIEANSFLHYSPISVINGNISKDPITITYKGLPANITISPSTVIVDSIYTPIVVFTANNATTGVYPMQIVISSNSIGTQAYNFNLTVSPASNCASSIRSSIIYSTFGSTSGCGGSYNVTLDTVPNTPNMFTISNFGNLGASIKVSVLIDCGAIVGSTLNEETAIYIPRQTLNGYTISGSGVYQGTLGNSTIEISDTITNANNVTTICPDLELEP